MYTVMPSHINLYESSFDPWPYAYFHENIDNLESGDIIEYNSSNQDGFAVYKVVVKNGEKQLEEIAGIRELADMIPPEDESKKPKSNKTKLTKTKSKEDKSDEPESKKRKTSRGGKRRRNKKNKTNKRK